MPNIPKSIPATVLTDSFSCPIIKFKTKTQKGESVEIRDANPLVMYFSAYVVKPLAKTIMNSDKMKARKNCLVFTRSNFFCDNK